MAPFFPLKFPQYDEYFFFHPVMQAKIKNDELKREITQQGENGISLMASIYTRSFLVLTFEISFQKKEGISLLFGNFLLKNRIHLNFFLFVYFFLPFVNFFFIHL